MSATLKERQASQSSNPPLDLPDDIASGLSSDEEEAPSNEPEHLPEDTFLIQQPAAAQSQPDNAFSRLPCMVESIFKCCLGNMLWQEMHPGVSFNVSHLQGHCCIMDDLYNCGTVLPLCIPWHKLCRIFENGGVLIVVYTSRRWKATMRSAGVPSSRLLRRLLHTTSQEMSGCRLRLRR